MVSSIMATMYDGYTVLLDSIATWLWIVLARGQKVGKTYTFISCIPCELYQNWPKIHLYKRGLYSLAGCLGEIAGQITRGCKKAGVL